VPGWCSRPDGGPGSESWRDASGGAYGHSIRDSEQPGHCECVNAQGIMVYFYCFNFLLLLLAPMFWSFSLLSKILIIKRNSLRQGLRQNVVLFFNNKKVNKRKTPFSVVIIHPHL
jgi:hypothetical protein